MPPKRKNEEKTPSIIDAFNAIKKQSKLSPGNKFEPNEVIDISESQEEDAGPSTATAIPSIKNQSTMESIRKWKPGEENSKKRMPYSVRRSLIQSISDSDLRDMGCDAEELKVIEVNSTVECIQEDVELIRKLISFNCAIIHPRRSSFIVSVFLANWLRIFPVGRICIYSPDGNWFEALKEECSLMGIEPASFTHIEQSAIPPSSRIMLVSKRILNALISHVLASEIRCIIFYLLASQTPDKLKSVVNEMFLKRIPCRFIVIGGGGSHGSKASAIARRQTMITTLHLSEWMEPREELFVSVIKPRLQSPVRLSFWKENDNPYLIESIDHMEEVIKEFIGVSGMGIDILPRDLMFAPLNILSNAYGDSEEMKCLLSLLYHFFSFGKAAFEKRLATARECGELGGNILSSGSFTRIIKNISELEGDEHRKIKLVKDIIHKAVTAEKGLMKGIILVDSLPLVEAMTECLSMRCKLIGVTIYPMGRPTFPLSRISTVLQSGGVAILSIHNQEGINAFQSIASSHLSFVISTSRRSAINVDTHCIREWHLILHQTKERIRGRIDEEEKTLNHERIKTAFELENYPFHYERSSLPLDASSAVVRLSTTKRVCLLNGVSLNPTQRYILSSRCIEWRRNGLPITLTPSSLLWNESLHSSHPSSLSRRLVSSISPFIPPSLPSHHPSSLPPPSPPSPSLPCPCTPSEIEAFYYLLSSKLSHLFT